MEKFLIWFLYFLGQVLHILMGAYLIIQSGKNNITSIPKYLHSRMIPLFSRLFLTTLCFVILWNNPSIGGGTFQKFIVNPWSQCAVAGILGWFSDSVMDKVIALIPWLGKELPVVNGENS